MESGGETSSSSDSSSEEEDDDDVSTDEEADEDESDADYPDLDALKKSAHALAAQLAPQITTLLQRKRGRKPGKQVEPCLRMEEGEAAAAVVRGERNRAKPQAFLAEPAPGKSRCFLPPFLFRVSPHLPLRACRANAAAAGAGVEEEGRRNM